MTANIERFEEIAKKILIALYESFPAADYLGPNELGLTDEEPSRDKMGGRVVSNEWEKLNQEVRRAMAWLVEEGLVHDRQYKMSASHVLTSRGFNALEELDPAYKAPAVAKSLA
ncbi:hypothetical protein G7007_19325 [Pseudomonas entomophila]|uniref:hypothetical protein n=1 Tax=Pseudomonas entomophila TaxID=312306 RepID=UPI0015E2DBB1|nr:hypothetical protein [Pseudomonas entomophila]MBA1194981.1 hypothetical protein [Pseudomonas entomophila]